MSKKPRKNYTAQEKVAILRRHLLEHVPLSEVCEQEQLQPTVFYRWQKQFFENGPLTFTAASRRATAPLEKKVSALEQKLARKNEVIAELMEEHLKLKQAFGDL